MPDEDAYANRDASVTETIERLRADRFQDVDRGLVLEILKLHADGVTQDNASRLVDEAIAQRASEDE